MRRAVILSLRGVLAALALAVPASSGLAQINTRRPPDPVVVELFTAQGCTACPEANAWAGRLAGRRQVIVLTYPVGYWDYLGWRDTLARPAFAARQKAYRAKLGLRDMYTPQLIIDGRRECPGNKPKQALRMIGESAPTLGPRVTLDRSGERAFVSGGALPPGGAEVWLVRYDPRDHAVAVTEGENRGATVHHRNTVRELVRLGPWTGRGRSYALPIGGAELKTVVLVQALRRQGVLAAARN